MRKLIGSLVALALPAAFLTWRAFTIHEPHRPDGVATAEMVRRGEYLTRAADCAGCHTAPQGEPFAGGRALDAAGLGTLYTSNITPDRETGIGAWSDDEFRAALHLGIGKGGKRLYPAFPYASYTLLSDEDVLAIKAYLFSLKPVRALPPPNELRFPYNLRFLNAFWSWLYDPNERARPDPERSAAWNRGRYLVEGLGHCGECHTPRTALQALDRSRALSGAVAERWLAYNITPARSGIGGWSDAELTEYLSTGFTPAHGAASGPMAAAVANSLRFLEPGDLTAMIVYLRSLPALETGSSEPAGAAPTVAKASGGLEYGRTVYAGICASCHGLDGGGSLVPFASLTGARSVREPQAINMRQAVLYGSEMETRLGEVSMPGFAHGYSDEQLAAAINYASLQLTGRPGVLTAADIAHAR